MESATDLTKESIARFTSQFSGPEPKVFKLFLSYILLIRLISLRYLFVAGVPSFPTVSSFAAANFWRRFGKSSGVFGFTVFYLLTGYF